MPYAGRLAALATAMCWTISALSFEAAGRRIGSMAVNFIRLVMAWGLLALYGWLVRGVPLPTDAPGRTWLWISLSGLVGFFFCDLCLFRAWVLIGPRLGTLVFSLAPPITALLAWLVLGETLTPLNWLGMAVTLGGVAWVVAERRIEAAVTTWRVSRWGVTLAVCGAAGQAAANVFIKVGLGTYDAVAATHIRVTSGLLAFAVLFSVIGWYPRVVRGLGDRRAMGLTGLGAFAGPFVGVSLLVFSLRRLPAGMTQTFVATLPVLILPFTMVLYKERVSLRAAAGAGLAVAGVAMLFL